MGGLAELNLMSCDFVANTMYGALNSGSIGPNACYLKPLNAYDDSLFGTREIRFDGYHAIGNDKRISLHYWRFTIASSAPLDAYLSLTFLSPGPSDLLDTVPATGGDIGFHAVIARGIYVFPEPMVETNVSILKIIPTSGMGGALGIPVAPLDFPTGDYTLRIAYICSVSDPVVSYGFMRFDPEEGL